MKNTSMKRCYCCKQSKPLECFGKKATNKDGLQRICKECQKIERKAYYDTHKDKEFENHRKYESANKDRINKRRNETRAGKPDYYQKVQKYVRKRKSTDLNYLISSRIRYRMQSALAHQKAKSSMPILRLYGCTIEAFIAHLETTAPSGFSWEAYREGRFQIDHIIPCSCFDLSIPAHQRTCFNFSNTRMLEKRDNASKRYNLFLSPEEIEAIVAQRAL